MEALIVFFFWLFLAILVGIFAHKRGRMGFGWFMLSVMFSPLLMWLLLLVLVQHPATRLTVLAEQDRLAARESRPTSTCCQVVERRA